MLRVHGLDMSPHAPPQRLEPRHGGGIRVRGRRQDGEPVLEKLREPRLGPGMLGAGHRVARHEVHAFGQVRAHRRQDRALHRAHVGDDRTGCQVRLHRRRNGAACADRGRDDDQVRRIHGIADLRMHAVRDREVLDALAHIRIGIMARDMRGQPIRADRQGERRSDQADADDRDALEYRLLAHASSTNVRRASTTSCISSRCPIDMRTHSGRP